MGYDTARFGTFVMVFDSSLVRRYKAVGGCSWVAGGGGGTANLCHSLSHRSYFFILKVRLLGTTIGKAKSWKVGKKS